MEQNNIDFNTNTPANNHVEAVDYALHFSTWSLEYLKSAAIQLKLVKPRSLAWAIMLNALPSPSSDIISSIKAHRNFYDDLKEKLSMDPRAVIDDDPLSQNDESVWKQHFCDNELKAMILQDVVRTYPDEVYFRDKEVQNLMVRVLFYWARSHSVGYRQGMHEILAPLLFELHGDRKYAPDDISDTLKYYLNKEYLEHDSHMLFNAVMKGLEKFYTTGDVVPTASGRLPTSRSVHNQNEVVRYLERVKEEYLVPLDLELATHLTECNISMELFGIRWLRLLFGREFPRSEIPLLWGFIFADGPMMPNLHYIIVAMLISMKSALPHAPPAARDPLRQILQLAALLQCRNHALIDVETALEAAENQIPEAVGQHQIVPVRTQPPRQPRQVRKVKEVPLKVFHQVECPQPTDLPFLDPLRLRTD